MREQINNADCIFLPIDICCLHITQTVRLWTTKEEKVSLKKKGRKNKYKRESVNLKDRAMEHLFKCLKLKLLHAAMLKFSPSVKTLHINMVIHYSYLQGKLTSN